MLRGFECDLKNIKGSQLGKPGGAAPIGQAFSLRAGDGDVPFSTRYVRYGFRNVRIHAHRGRETQGQSNSSSSIQRPPAVRVRLDKYLPRHCKTLSTFGVQRAKAEGDPTRLQ
jgi:hypothetical protein